MALKMKSLLLVALASITVFAEHIRSPVKRSYACPPKFIRLSHRCYFFSKEKTTWQEAYFQCQSMHSNLAIIKNINQEKLIRKTLSRSSLEPLERWIGGRFDWQQKRWKWAASGKTVLYDGFDSSVNQTEENLQWNCIVIDPKLDYKWNSKSCLQEKHFICHKKIQTITNNRSRKKLLQQYNMNPLNEVPIPDISNDILSNSSHYKGLQKILPARSVGNLFQIEVNSEFKSEIPKKRKRNGRKKKKNQQPVPLLKQFPNGTVYENTGQQNFRRRRNKVRDEEVPAFPMKIYYKSYKESSKSTDPLRPKPIVEEYNFAKEI